MQLFTQWKGVSRYLLSDAATFYEHYDESHGVGYPLAYLALSLVVVSSPLFLFGAASNPSDPTNLAGAAAGVLVLAGGLWLWTLVEAALAHGILVLFGASGYSTSLEAYAFPSVIRYAIWWVPILGIVPGFVGLYLQVRGLGRFHDVSEAAAAFAAILALVLTYVLFLLSTLGLVYALGLASELPTSSIPV